MKEKDIYKNRRKYVRLETVFPIEYQVISAEKGEAITDLQQGFTRNVSKGGMCLEINELQKGVVEKMGKPGTRILVYINMPFSKDPIKAETKVMWRKKLENGLLNKYLFGIEYINMLESVRSKIFDYARKRQRRPRVIAGIIILLLLSSAFLAVQLKNINTISTLTEKQLLKLENELESSSEKRMVLEKNIYSLDAKRKSLQDESDKYKETIDSLRAEAARVSESKENFNDKVIARMEKVEEELITNEKEREVLLGKIDLLTNSRESLKMQLESLKDLKSARIVKLNLKNGNSVIGQLMDVTEDNLELKIGLGTIGVERSSIDNVKEVSGKEKINIQEEWQKQEEDAKRDGKKYKEFVDSQRQKGLVYYNGRWITQQEATKTRQELEEKEKQVFELIASQKNNGSGEKGIAVLQDVLETDKQPLISIKDNRIYVNGKLFFIKGVGYGIEYPGTKGGMSTYKKVSKSVFENDFRLMKEAGINTIRTYEPLPSNMLDLAEEYGIMVIENICYPSENTDFTSRVHLDLLKEQIKKYVLRDRKRECILMWCIWNDAPWSWTAAGDVTKRYGFETVNNFLKELYETVKKYDVSHPVTGGNSLEMTGSALGWNFLDIIGLNVYIGGYDWFIETEALRQVNIMQKLQDKYDKPVVVLETGYSTYVEGHNQEDVLDRQISIAGNNIAGITIFQWADGWHKAGDKDKLDNHIEEHWGIMDGYRNPKPGYLTVKKMFNEIDTNSFGYNDKEDL